MTPDQFLGKVKRGAAPAYLFLGPEAYMRDRCRAGLINAVLSPEERENGIARFDLHDAPLRDVVDDALSLSLFASNRVIIVSNAEDAMPRQKAGEEEEDGDAPSGGVEPLVEYLKNPSPGVTLLMEAVRFDFEGDDKKKNERVRKFYSCVSEVVELRRPGIEEARMRAQSMAKTAGIAIDGQALDLLVESLGGDVARIAVEMEKMSLYSPPDRTIGVEEIADLVPDARVSTIFALVNALGRRDRSRSLEILDALTREGEYLPLALAFLSTQFRMALVASEAGLRSAQQIQGHFTRAGVPMWGSRAEQVASTATKFSRDQLESGMKLIFEADRDLRSPRPDDRIVFENLILKLT